MEKKTYEEYEARRDIDEKVANAISEQATAAWWMGCRGIHISFNDEGFVNIDTNYPDGSAAAAFEQEAEDVLNDAARAARDAARTIRKSAGEKRELDVGLLGELADACRSAMAAILVAEAMPSLSEIEQLLCRANGSSEEDNGASRNN